MIDIQPILLGECVELRPLAESDWDELFAVASDPLIWEQHPASNRYLEPVFRQFFRDALESGGALVASDKSGSIIGSSRFSLDPDDPRQIEIGWSFLARAYWGKGFNLEMKTLMLRHAFRFVDVVTFRVGETNWRSRKALEKIGGVLTERRVMAPLSDGTLAPHVVFEITRRCFENGGSGAAP
jgi:RimJ/RimL family protein N-acetyltransferase